MSSIKIIALGGVRENGKSLYAVEVEEDIFVLDCGLVYPEDELLGIDVVIPDFSYLEENKERIAGVFLTHGHADAVGALPYFLQNIDAPVFGSKLTIALAKYYVESSKLVKGFNDYHEVTENTEIDFASATIKFFKTTHTIPDSLAIVIKTSEGNIVYTGDFKFDQSASVEYQTNFGRITDVGEDYVLALLSDSKLEIELFKIQQKLELEVLNETKLELQDIANKEQKINDNLYEKVLDVGNAKLSEYVLHRKQVLDLLELNLRKENGIYTKEEAIHNLIFPLRKTSDDIFLEEHNLWVIDDRLSFHDYLASDKTFKSNKRVPSVSTKETDLMIFNRAHLLTDEQKPYSSIIIIEFKRPMRNDYTNSENPINQINTYVRELIDNKVFE